MVDLIFWTENMDSTEVCFTSPKYIKPRMLHAVQVTNPEWAELQKTLLQDDTKWKTNVESDQIRPKLTNLNALRQQKTI